MLYYFTTFTEFYKRLNDFKEENNLFYGYAIARLHKTTTLNTLFRSRGQRKMFMPANTNSGSFATRRSANCVD